MKQKGRFSVLCVISTLIVFFASCNSEEKATGIENLVRIKLKLENYDSSEHKSFIDLTVENKIHPNQQQLKVSDSGTVEVNFISTTKKEINFNYDDRDFNLIVSPNESLEINLKINELLDWSRFKNFEVKGVNSETNTQLIRHKAYLDSLLRSATIAPARDGTYSEIEYKEVRLREMKQHLGIIEKFILKNNITDTTFIDWVRAKIYYGAGNDLSLYPFYGVFNKEIDDKNPYFDFTNDVLFGQKNELIYFSYLEYMKNLSMSYVIMSNISDTYESERLKLPKEPAKNFPIAFEMFKRLPKSKSREYMMTYAFFSNQMQTPEKYRDSLNTYVSLDILASLKPEMANETLNVINLLKNYDISASEKEELLNLYKNTEGKVIFHDFWFASCQPCIKEFPYYNNLILSNNNNQVAFIFYGTYMKENEWKETIKKYDLKGVHHLLSKDQLAFFQKYFGVKGFPHHQIVNSEGNIVDEVIPRTNPNNQEFINELISKHIKAIE